MESCSCISRLVLVCTFVSCSHLFGAVCWLEHVENVRFPSASIACRQHAQNGNPIFLYFSGDTTTPNKNPGSEVHEHAEHVQNNTKSLRGLTYAAGNFGESNFLYTTGDNETPNKRLPGYQWTAVQPQKWSEAAALSRLSSNATLNCNDCGSKRHNRHSWMLSKAHQCQATLTKPAGFS